jgi:hypothetical protein
MGFEGVIRRPSEGKHQVRALDVLRTYLLINVSSGAQSPKTGGDFSPVPSHFQTKIRCFSVGIPLNLDLM